jgi:hypothetical protein
MRQPAKHTSGDSHGVARHNLSTERPQQLDLVHEESADLLRALVAALGGAKRVGPRLYPTKGEEAAARTVYDNLNPDRNHAFDLDEVLLLLQWAREAGAHFGFYWLCDRLNYAHPQPVSPEDVRAELQREFIACAERMEHLAQRLGK